MTDRNKHKTDLPAGWVEIPLGEVADYLNGRAFKPAEWEEEGLPIIRIQNLNDIDARFNYTTQNLEDRYFVNNGDLLFAWSASLGSYIWHRGPAWLNQHIFKVIPKNFIAKQYLHYCFKKFILELYEKTHGSGMVHITKKKFETTVIPLPPLTEQHRIVAKIEELFSDLDHSVAALRQARAQLKTYRQAALKYAFEGKLTEKWRQTHTPPPAAELLAQIKAEREKNGNRAKPLPHLTEAELAELPRLPEGWCWVDLSHLKEFSIYGPRFSSKDYSEKGVAVLRTSDISEYGKVDWKNSPKLPLSDTEYEKYKLVKNDLLITRTGSIGTISVYNDDKKAIPGAFLIHYRLTSLLNIWYIFYYLKSSKAQTHFKEKSSGVGRPNLNVPNIELLKIPLPSLSEQHAIVEEIEARLSVVDKLEETIETSLQQAEALRQSILKRAFAGKLVPQDPADEPAEKLLERIKFRP